MFMKFVLKGTPKALGEHRIKWRGKDIQDLECADDLGLVDESVRRMSETLDVL